MMLFVNFYDTMYFSWTTWLVLQTMSMMVLTLFVVQLYVVVYLVHNEYSLYTVVEGGGGLCIKSLITCYCFLGVVC